MTNLHEILTAAQSLPPQERVQLIAALWSDVSPEQWVPPSQEWLDEVNRRSNDFDAGKITGSAWSEVRQRAQRKAGIDD